MNSSHRTNIAPAGKPIPAHGAVLRRSALAAAVAAAFALPVALPVGGLAVTALVAMPLEVQAANWAVATGTAGTRFVSMSKVGTTLYAGANGGGLYMSTDDGANWFPVGGVPFATWNVYDVTQIGNILYVGGSDSGGAAKLAYSSDSGLNWTVQSAWGTTYYINDVAQMGGATYVAAFGGGVYISAANDGTGWVASNAGLPSDKAAKRFAQIGTDIFLAVASAPDGGVFKSSDGGVNWVRAINGLDISDFGGIVSIISHNGILFVGSNSSGLWKSSDSGANWTQVGGSELNAYDIVSINNILYLLTADTIGLYTSTDDGANWVLQSTDGITADYLQPGLLVSNGQLMMNSNAGIWRKSDPVASYTLSLTAPSNGAVTSNTGGINCGATCSASYTSGASVALTATASSGYTFSSWGGDCSGSTNPLTVTLSAAKACTATFALLGPTLVSSVPADNASGVLPGATVALTFDDWISIDVGNLKIVNDTDSTTETISVASPGGKFAWSGNHKTLTITPGTPLAAGKSYHIEIDAHAFIGNANEAPYAGITNATTLNFSVANAPSVPTGITATSGNGQIGVAFTPGANGGSTITGYTASCISSDGGVAGSNTGAASPIVVTGLTNGKTYTCTVTATNGVGDSSASTASSAANPLVVPTLTTPTASPSANLATLSLQSDSTGTGYFTLLASGGNCGAGAQVKAGADGSDSASIHGSLPLTANVAGSYTVRNLLASTTYKLCFTADDGATLQGTPVSANLTTNAANELTGLSWNAVGGAGFSSAGTYYESLAFAPDGAPYVVFQDGANSSKATVMKYSGDAWSVVGSAGFSAGNANYNSLAFAPDGTPYLAYVDNGNSAKATVKKFDGANWVTVGGAGFSAGTAQYTSLAFAPDGTPYVAYSEFSNGRKATVKKFDGANWVAVGLAGFTTGQASSESLAFAPDGTPYLAFFDGDYFSATVMKFNGTAWVTVGNAGFSTAGPSYLSLAFTQDGTPHVAYRDAGNGNKATVMKYSGGAWADVGGAGFSAAGGSSYTSLAVGPDGALYVAYEDSGASDKATVMKYSGGAWSVVGSAGFSAGAVGYTSLAFAPDGTPYLAYQDNGNAGKATLMKLDAGAIPPDGPTGITATAGNGSVTVSFTAPANAGGAAISEYTVSCDAANRFSGAGYAFNQPGAVSPITVSGLTNGTAYKCLVKAKNSAGYGNGSDISASFTPAAPPTPPAPSGGGDYTPPAPSNPTLPSGGGTVAPTNGQTVTVTDNGKEGSSISLPSQTTTTGIGGATTTTSNTIKVDLPGTGTVSASSTSQDTKLGVTSVTLPGSTTPVSAVTVDQGSASFTASEKGQAVAGLKNGIVVVSGAKDSQVSVDATGPNTTIGIKSADTLIVPTGATNVAGTKVDLPPPTASGGHAATVNLNIGGHELTIQSSQANTTMTFEVVDIGGVQTPVLAVTGNAQVSSSGEDQPLVSVAGNVIKSGKSSGGSSQACNTIVQASSDASSDVVHVVTCYIVLEAGTFSAIGGGRGAGTGTGTGNNFAAIKDGIVWAGETAEFDKNGKVISAYVGTRSGDTDAVGDDMVPGGGKFAAGSYQVGAFVPRLNGTPLRLNGARLDESLFTVVKNALNVTVLPSTPSQNAQGVLNFNFAGNLINQGVQSANVSYTINSDTASVLPSRRVRVDTSRTDGVSISAEGNVDVAVGGLVTTFVASVPDPKLFAEKIDQALPGSTSVLRWNGTWQVKAADGTTYVGRPQWSYWTAAPGAATFSTLADGNLLYSDNGVAQLLFPDFYDYDTLQGTFRAELSDPALTVLPRMDGTATATVNGQTYTLAPQWNLMQLIAGKPAWWMEGGVVYIKNADGSAQGFTVK